MGDVELLPCSVEHELRVDAAIIRNGIDGVRGPINRDALADRLDRYAHAAAAQSSEIEALRAEVNALRAEAETLRAMSEKPVAPIKTLARYEPDTVYIGTGEYVAECVRADDGDYYLAADVDAAIEALRAEVERSERYAEQSERERLWAEAHAERLAEALRDARARTANLAAWLKSGNDVPADLPFVFRERWQKIAADIRALEAALTQEDRNG